MDISKIRSWECPICFDPIENPMIHSECGNTMDYQCAVDSVQKYGRCPSCNVNATIEQFKPNVALRDGMEELQKNVPKLLQGEVTALPPPSPQPSFAPSVSRRDKKAFCRVKDRIKKEDQALFNAHVKKDSTRKLQVDWGNRYVAVFKSGNWHFYKIGNGAAPELCKNKHFNVGVRVLFSV